jgi:hypothetical protein
MADALILPEGVLHNLLSEQERYWNPILQRIDPDLRLAQPTSRPVPGMLPMRWHFVMVNEHGGAHYIPITGPNGEFREMDESVLEQLRRMDNHSNRNRRQRREDERQQRAARERAEQRAKDDRIGAIAERLERIDHIGIRVPKSIKGGGG